MLNKRLIKMLLEKHIQSLDKTTAEGIWDARRATEALENLSAYSNPFSIMEKGGEWLGTAREWIQCKFNNGSDVTWGSQDVLTGRTITVYDIEQLAARVAAAAINEYKNSNY